MMSDPSDVVIAVTFRCNAHCVMCNIWKSHAQDTLRPEHMRRLPPGLRTVNLSGGEPFIRPDLPEFVREVRHRCPRVTITISTNAYLGDRIVETMRDIRSIDPAVRLAISLDGIGDAHDAIRGDSGAFGRVVKLIDDLRADGFNGLRLSMTLSADNAGQFLPVADFAAERGLELGVVAAHAATTHLGIEGFDDKPLPDDAAEGFLAVIARWLRDLRPKQWLRAHFAYHTWEYLHGRRPMFRCRAGRDFFFLQADGAVYSCSVRGREMGNLTQQDWADIWSGPAAEEARRSASACNAGCWMICTARSVYRARPWRVIGWVAWHKLLAHLRRYRLR